MTRSPLRALPTVSLLLLAVLLPSREADAGEKSFKEQLVGSWTLVLVDNVLPDGKRVQLYGAEPQGLLMFDGRGRYSIQILRAGRARFASSDKNQGTPEENQATVRGTNSHFGRYSVNEVEHTVTFHIDHASFPNWEGTQQRRTFTLTGDELKYIVPAPTTGGTGAVGEVKWRRAK
ncbi:lipocalin-like domain-containing protein [Myxococcus llanfairpwllgwyngyllgogerychwyrndrobwllllantysiliogogogochensis]|uniref:lipocalin-like domain-containing protein n=1 Tax=Myxococcus llanfairpwllgwyngyllgogerychwyrndrobwllllantysiliogogogochensis TaxID=2590453 RepID=UPI001C67E05B|nr:lipocalin-like domain-containing protein [Myxococcus llanfairpwllgwyngyllgogerychwyrndrobwllllantysiliogogogochensis]